MMEKNKNKILKVLSTEKQINFILNLLPSQEFFYLEQNEND